MKKQKLRFGQGFRIAIGNRRSQAAEMVLPPGESEGEADNKHRGSDQWLFVLAGNGEAIVNRKKYALAAGSLILIEHGDLHEIKNTGTTPLKTLSVYVPPAYTSSGEPLPRGRK